MGTAWVERFTYFEMILILQQDYLYTCYVTTSCEDVKPLSKPAVFFLIVKWRAH